MGDDHASTGPTMDLGESGGGVVLGIERKDHDVGTLGEWTRLTGEQRTSRRTASLGATAYEHGRSGPHLIEQILASIPGTLNENLSAIRSPRPLGQTRMGSEHCAYTGGVRGGFDHPAPGSYQGQHRRVPRQGVHDHGGDAQIARGAEHEVHQKRTEPSPPSRIDRDREFPVAVRIERHPRLGDDLVAFDDHEDHTALIVLSDPGFDEGGIGTATGEKTPMYVDGIEPIVEGDQGVEILWARPSDLEMGSGHVDPSRRHPAITGARDGRRQYLSTANGGDPGPGGSDDDA